MNLVTAQTIEHAEERHILATMEAQLFIVQNRELSMQDVRTAIVERWGQEVADDPSLAPMLQQDSAKLAYAQWVGNRHDAEWDWEKHFERLEKERVAQMVAQARQSRPPAGPSPSLVKHG